MFDPKSCPYSAPETVDALTAFEPRTEPYRDVPEIVDAFTVFEPSTEPYKDPEIVEALIEFDPNS